MHRYLVFILYSFSVAVLSLSSCRGPEVVPPPKEDPTGDTTEIPTPSDTLQKQIVGFYLLNEGSMGTNKATLDYYDFLTGIYSQNIYSQANPDVPQSLGDVGNDLKIYGNRMYAVINCSNLLEVMTADSAKHLGTIEVPNCRYLCFQDNFGYLTSYAGPVSFDPDYEQIGYVAKFDTATLKIVDTCYVGFQPDGLEIVGNKLYVANSGGYMFPDYEHTVSVIDLTTFRETKRIDVAVNLHHICADSHNQLWVTSRGDFYEIPSKLYCIDIETDLVVDSIDIPVTNFWLDGDSLYTYSSAFSYITMREEQHYKIIDVRTHQIISERFIAEDVKITTPYGIIVHPNSKNIYLADAKYYVTPGLLNCFDPTGALKWSVVTGDTPAHMAFLYKEVAPTDSLP